jgi:Ni/Fe-hydrogenase subunit HybB-like protein
VKDLSDKAIAFDHKAGRFLTIIGIPSAVLLHGYVGFIFGSVKGNPWWSSVLMPIIFLLSAIVSGIAMVLVLYVVTSRWRRVRIDVRCLQAIGRYLMFALIFDLTLEMLDMVHRFYEAGEWMEILKLLSSGYLYQTIFGVQFFLGGLVPLVGLGLLQAVKITDRARINSLVGASMLVLIGVLFMRWNVVIGGQLFSKSLKGLTTYRLEFIGGEGVLVAAAVFALPFVILWVLVKLLPPWVDKPVLESGG